jgi:hypothetical protein
MSYENTLDVRDNIVRNRYSAPNYQRMRQAARKAGVKHLATATHDLSLIGLQILEASGYDLAIATAIAAQVRCGNNEGLAALIARAA